jgi:hypothetical protein
MRPRYMRNVLQFCEAGRGLGWATSSFGHRWQQREGGTDKVSQVEGFVLAAAEGTWPRLLASMAVLMPLQPEAESAGKRVT